MNSIGAQLVFSDTTKRLVLAAFLLLSGSITCYADAPPNPCDVQAASPTDPNRKSPGKDWDAIDPALAVSACEAAVRYFPNEARLQAQMGRAYQSAKRESDAVIWYQKAADQGYALAQNNLGAAYKLGTGISKDVVKASFWYQKAADQGYSLAQSNLGTMYEEGAGVPKDLVKAASWYQKAADQGYAPAQVKLGTLYRTGAGVPKDDSKAAFWYKKAADLGFEPAKKLLQDLQGTFKLAGSAEGTAEDVCVGKLDEKTIQNCDAAIKMSPDVGRLYYHRGIARIFFDSSDSREENIHADLDRGLTLHKTYSTPAIKLLDSYWEWDSKNGKKHQCHIAYSLHHLGNAIQNRTATSFGAVGGNEGCVVLSRALAEAYLLGDYGVKQNFAKAIEWYDSCSWTNPIKVHRVNCVERLALAYQNNVLTKPDDEKAYTYALILCTHERGARVPGSIACNDSDNLRKQLQRDSIVRAEEGAKSILRLWIQFKGPTND